MSGLGGWTERQTEGLQTAESELGRAGGPTDPSQRLGGSEACMRQQRAGRGDYTPRTQLYLHLNKQKGGECQAGWKRLSQGLTPDYTFWEVN